MKILKDLEEAEAMKLIDIAAGIASKAQCFRSKCGSIIVKDGKIIGQGYNSPPEDVTPQFCLKDFLSPKFRSDNTCCIHAEQRAIMNALKNHSEKVSGSRIYFIRLDDKGQKVAAGKPYCTHCSKFALDVGITEFVLLHDYGITVYDTKEYNRLSFEYNWEAHKS